MLSTFTLLAAAAAPSGPHTLEDWLELARRESPAVRQADAVARAGAAEADAAGVLPRPSLSYAFAPVPIETRLGPQRHRLGVRQAVPFPTRLTAAAEAGRARAAADGARARDARRTVAARVGEAYVELWAARARREVAGALHASRQRGIDALRGAVAALEASPGQLARAEVAIASLEARLALLDGAIDEREIGLRAAVGLEPAGRAKTAGLPATLAPPVTSSDALARALTATSSDPLARGTRADGLPRGARSGALGPPREGPRDGPGGGSRRDEGSDAGEDPSSHPRIEAAESAARAAEASRRGAEASRLPDVVLGATWLEVGTLPDRPDSGRDAFNVELGLSLPLWWGAEAAGARAAETRAEAAREGAREVTLALRALRARLRARVAAGRRRLERIEEAEIPAAERWLATLRGALAAAQVRFDEVVEAENLLLEARLGAIDAKAALAQARLARLALDHDLEGLLARLRGDALEGGPS